MSSGINSDMAMMGGPPLPVGPVSPAADAGLRPGQRVAARVLQMLPSGDVLLGFGQSQAVVATSNALRPGDRVALEVVTGGPTPEFRMMSVSMPVSPLPADPERVSARVVGMLPNGDVVLEVGQDRAVVRTNNLLQPGERVVVEVVAGGPRSEFRIVAENTAATPPPAAGQRLAATVLEMLPGGDVLLAVGQDRAVVRTSNPLQPGEQVVLDVVAGGPKPEFRIVTGNATASPPPVGQRLEGRVLEMLPSGDVLLQFGQSRASVRTLNPLQPGERVVLEVVGGGPKPEVRIVTDNTAAGPTPAAGPRLEARVIEMLPSGDVLLEFGQNRAVVRTVNPLQPGERVVLELVTAGPKPELRIVTDHMAANPAPAADGQQVDARVLKMLPNGEVLLELGQSRAVVRTSNLLQPGNRVVLEVVSDGSTSELRIVPDNMAAGQRVAARVLEMLPSGDVLVELGQSRAVVRTSSQLQPGERVVLEVVTGGPKPELRMVSDGAGSQPARPVDGGNGTAAPPSRVDGSTPPLSARDLPVIMRALGDLRPPGASIADSGQEFLRAATTSDLRAVVVDQIQRLLAPLEASLPPAALAGMIRTFLAQSGLFTENHLREALTNGARTGQQEHVVSDLRLLLGELTTRGERVPDAVRAFGDALLQQQLATADRLAATGVGQLAVPIMFGETRVDVVFEWERKARREQPDKPDQAISLGVFVHLKTLGAIEARLEWQPEALAVTFFVEREATRAIVEAGLDDFSKHLALAGCPGVTSNVFLNPDRPSLSSQPSSAPIPGGTILDVMV
jgi:hypothetical protein